MAGISTPGIGTGLDINSIVSGLVQAEGSTASNRLNVNESLLQAELSSIGLLQSAVSQFQSSLSSLSDANNFTSRSIAVADTAVAAAAISTGANPSVGSYSLEVTQLANKHKLISSAVADPTDIGTGTITITTFGADKLAPSDGGDSGDGDSFSIDTATADADSSGAVTLEELRDAINEATDNPGVIATILTTDAGKQLIITADDSGLENAFEVTNSFTLTINNLVDTNDSNYAKDAQIKVDGQTVTSSSNDFTDVIAGVTITAKTTNIGSPTTIDITVDNSSATAKVNEFVAAYNTLMDTFNQHSAYDPDNGGASSVLFGDSLLRSLQSQIRSGISETVDSITGQYNSLASLGITTDSSGKLSVDSTKLSTALDAEFSSVVQLFSATDGIATRLDSQLDNYLNTGGTFDSRTDSINSKLDNIQSDREALALRLEKYEARLLSQFIAMDTLVARLNSTSEWLQAQLDTLPGFVRNTDK